MKKLKSPCEKTHLLFIPTENGDHQAVDTWCGRTTHNKIWFCSKECKEVYEESKNGNL